MVRAIGIGGFSVSRDREDTLKTYALASCVAVTAYSPVRRVAGLIHIALPAADSILEQKARPAYYARTGIPLLIDTICVRYGCLKGELKIDVFGGANSIRQDDRFQIGRRNLEEVEYQLNRLQMKYHAKEVGGTVSRTVEIEVATGTVRIYTNSIWI